MNLRDVERILRNACMGRIPDDYAKMTAATALKLADAVAAADWQTDNTRAVLATLISYLHRELGTANAQELLNKLAIQKEPT